jgi:mannose-6-phosphate isomerase-like protein (cupin superfamily)
MSAQEKAPHPYAFDLEGLRRLRAASGKLYLEFLRVPALSGGLYVLETGATDPQQPHAEDEVYVVMSGKGKIRVGSEEQAVGAGSVVFVEAHLPHRFFDIEERLEILVFFGPAEHTGR